MRSIPTCTRTSWRVATVAALLLAGTGCDASPGDPDDDLALEPATQLRLGELDARRSFEPFAPTQTLEIHQGLQGGYHVFVDGQLRGDELDECLITLRMFRMDDDSEVTTIQHLREPDLLPDDEGNATLDDLIVFIPDPQALDGADVRVEATLDFEDEGVQGDEVLLHLVWVRD